MKFATSIIASSLFLVTLPAWAQDVTSTVQAEKNPAIKRFAVEVRPVETLVSSTPGVAAGGASVEGYIGRNWALNVGGSYGDIDLPKKYVASTTDETDEPMVETGYGYTVGAGLRYYDHPIGDSLYGGASLDYSENHTGWDYNDENYQTTQFAVTPSIVAGYRWVWQGGFLARLGAGVGLPSVQSQSVVAETSGDDVATGEQKVIDILDQKVAAKLDLGLGMMF